MTFHDKRLIAMPRVQVRRRKRMLMKEGALTLNLWQSMPEIKIGQVADDWKAVGADIRQAISQYAEDCG